MMKSNKALDRLTTREHIEEVRRQAIGDTSFADIDKRVHDGGDEVRDGDRA